MPTFQEEFLKFVIEHDILRFGEFTLKSGRQSPYFFNVGLFNTGEKLSFLAKCYAASIVHSRQEFDILFGPAYKGIPLVSAVAMALANDHGINKPFCFNRKEIKDHGERGLIIGAELTGKVMVIDDVITAGTAICEASDIIAAKGAELAGIAVAMDRQERGAGSLSAIQEIEQDHQIRVVSIINLQDIVNYLQKDDSGIIKQQIKSIVAYHREYGI